MSAIQVRVRTGAVAKTPMEPTLASVMLDMVGSTVNKVWPGIPLNTPLMENDVIIINSQTTLSLPWPEGNEEVSHSEMCYTDILTAVLFGGQPGNVQSEA